jgi:hypothetical protein
MNEGSSQIHRDDDDDCCSRKRQSVTRNSNEEALFHKLAIVIKARHMQLGGYSHDETEHLLEARRLLALGHESQARLEVHLALQKRALHARESVKYYNLVALRDTLQEAQRNLTLAQVLKDGSGQLQEQVAHLSKADLRLLQAGTRKATAAAVPEGQEPLLVSMEEENASATDEADEVAAKVTEEEVAAQLALLRLPATPSSTVPPGTATQLPERQRLYA